MSYQIIRRDCGATTVRCPSCGSIESVGDKRLARGRCRCCDKKHAQWQAELMAPFGKRPVAR